MNASEAAAAMGRIKTEKKASSSAANVAKGRERLQDPAVMAEANRKRAEAQKARWARVREEKAQAASEAQQGAGEAGQE